MNRSFSGYTKIPQESAFWRELFGLLDAKVPQILAASRGDKALLSVEPRLHEERMHGLWFTRKLSGGDKETFSVKGEAAWFAVLDEQNTVFETGMVQRHYFLNGSSVAYVDIAHEIIGSSLRAYAHGATEDEERLLLEIISGFFATLRERVQEERVPVVFIAHGAASDHKDLQIFLTNRGIKVETYETQSVAGPSVTMNVMNMIERADVAIVVMTAEDELSSGDRIPRPNVLHELGVADRAFGPDNVIIMRASDVAECGFPSNRLGAARIHFESGNIQGKFHEVLDALKAQFPAVR